MSSSLLMRPMRLEDIPQVLVMDRLSFPTPWSSRTYEFEIGNRETSHLVVLEAAESDHAAANGRVKNLIRRLWGEPQEGPVLVGYGGCWLIAGEAHISTIAVHPAFRGRNYGELLLSGMLGRALHLKAEYSVLEVRISNASAQALYRKYEYETVGIRKNYYRDNQEDAYLMEVRPLDSAYRQRFEQRVQLLRQIVCYTDTFTVRDCDSVV